MGAALSQTPAPMSAAELQETIVGKKVEHLRVSDQRVFIWDVRKSGTLYLHNTNLKGKWRLTDQGEFCVEWSTAQIPNQCYFFYDGVEMTAGPSSTPGQMTSRVQSVR